MEFADSTLNSLSDEERAVLAWIVMNQIEVVDDVSIQRVDESHMTSGVYGDSLVQNLEIIVTGMNQDGLFESVTQHGGGWRSPRFVDCDPETLFREHVLHVAKHIAGNRLPDDPCQAAFPRRGKMIDMREYLHDHPEHEGMFRLVVLNGRWKNYRRYYSVPANMACAYVRSEVSWVCTEWKRQHVSLNGRPMFARPTISDHTPERMRKYKCSHPIDGA